MIRYINGLALRVLGGAIPLLMLLVLVFLSTQSYASDGRLAILEFELHDLTLNPDVSGETERVATLQPLLKEALETEHKMEIVANPPSAEEEAAKGAGYVFDRPAVAARIGKEAGADWVVSGRLHKASFLFVYLKAQLINVESGAVSADFVVEIKGPQKKLTRKGVESLAVQINQAVATLN